MLLSNDASHPDFVRTLKQAATVPDEYSTLSRFLGLYPLAGIPVTIATAVAYQRYRKWHQTPLDELEIDGMIVRFYPREPDTPADSIGIRRLYDPPNLDAFGLPVLTRETERQLADLFAPAIHQDVVSGYDRIGRVTWEKNRVTVDPRYPTAYFYTSRSFLDGRPVLQLNFVFWYAERSGDNAPWIERGPLDGLTYRVTLNHEGQLAIADIMNTCGCYYFMVPRKALVDKIVVTPGEIAPLVPTWLPADDPQKRIALRVNSGWHQVQKVMVNADAGRMIPYDLVPYTELEMLQKNEGQKESVFTRDGIMKDSYRIEPYIFFSMGIPNIGFMRQRGHHAIKMVGRDHFTDPELFDKTFQYPPLVRQP